MNGKTFVRVFGFAQSYGHGWADALLSDTAEQDPIAGPFARAAIRRLRALNQEERAEAEAEMFSLAESLSQQKALVEAADRLLEAEQRAIAGLSAAPLFSERGGELRYNHVTGSGRLELFAHDGVVEFSISRPGEQDLLGVSVVPDTGAFRIYSGEPWSFLSEDHAACVRRWERLLRLRHVQALAYAVGSFFYLEDDRTLRERIIADIRLGAADVFRAQQDSAELSYWNSNKEKRHTMTLSEAFPDSSLSARTRAALIGELKLFNAYERNVCPTMIPFDYSPSSPEAGVFREFFGLPTEGVRYEDMQGVFAIFGNAAQSIAAGNGECCYAEFLFALGVTSSDVEKHSAKHSDEKPHVALREGMEEAVAEREGRGAFCVRRYVDCRMDYPAQSLAELGAE